MSDKTKVAGGQIWQHVKRGTTYEVIGLAELQIATGDLVEGSSVVLYRGDDGKLWAREEGEFTDGRFRHAQEAIAAAPTPEAAPTEAQLEDLAGRIADIYEFGPAALHKGLQDTNVGWGKRLVMAGKGEEHSGDCTKQPWSCMVCLRDEALLNARAAWEAALSTPPVGPTREEIAELTSDQIGALVDAAILLNHFAGEGAGMLPEKRMGETLWADDVLLRLADAFGLEPDGFSDNVLALLHGRTGE